MTTVFSLPVDTVRTRIYNARQETERGHKPVVSSAATAAVDALKRPANVATLAATVLHPAPATLSAVSAPLHSAESSSSASSGAGGMPKAMKEVHKPIQYSGAIDCMIRTLRTEGVRGLYKG